jgi:glyoxylase-like metal-dependent hydrolase (beta-lactamase superfamily II)
MVTGMSGPGLHEVAHGVYAWIGPEGRTNAAFITWDDGVLVVDSLYGPNLSPELIDQIRSVTDRPVQYVIDTHEHFDHCFGNQYFEPAVFVGHENCRRHLVEESDFQRDFAMTFRQEYADHFRGVRIIPPVVTFSDTMALHPGGRAVELHYLGRAHTAGDTVVWLPAEQVMIAGDIFVNGRAGFARDGYPRSWVAALARLEQFPARVFVPGHGDLGSTLDVATFRTWMDGCVREIAAAHAEGMSLERAQQELKIGVPESWPSPEGGMNLIAPFYREAEQTRT